MKVLSSTSTLLLFLAPLGLGAPLEKRQRTGREPIDPALYPTLVRYARFSGASLATLIFGNRKCPEPPYGSSLVSIIESKITDTQAIIFRDDAAKEFIISFVGSSSLQDFVTDFAFIQRKFPGCEDCKLHGAVYTAFQSVERDILTQFTQLNVEEPDYNFVVTGHSLGGGLAAVAYPALKTDAPSLPIRAAYTYGELRVGNQAFADYVDRISGASDTNLGTYIRATHNTDGVPNLPPANFNFKHSRTEIWQQGDTVDTVFRCFGQEAQECNLGAAKGFINQDHLSYFGVPLANGETCGVKGGASGGVGGLVKGILIPPR